MGTVMSSQKKGWKVRGVDQIDMPAELEKTAPDRGKTDLEEDLASEAKEAKEKLERWIQETSENMEYLQSSDDYATEECFKIYDNLRKASTLKPKSNRVLLADHLLSLGFVEIFPRMWNDLNSYQMYIDEPVPKAKQALTNLKRMLGSYWNFTDCSDKVCTEFGKLKCLDLLIEGLKDPELSVDRLNDDGKRYVVKGILGILHNCCRRKFKNRARCYGAIDNLQELSTSSYLIVRAKAFIILAYVAKKSEVEKLQTNDACMKFMLKMIEEALTYKNHVTKKYGFSACETLQGLNQLAINDENKKLIVELDGLTLIGKMLAEKCTDEEKETAAAAIWQLAFVDENKEKIRQDQQIIKSLMFLKNSENAAIRDACTGALWEIYDTKVPLGVHNDKSERSLSSSTISINSESPHIMISYQWDSQQRMIEVRDLLQKAGFNVWMDIDKMAGDILGAMAQAVERSALVLVCMTQKYFESHNGRTEATYAYKLKKPIIPLQLEEGYEGEGWLGALVGTLLYYKMYSNEVIPESFPALIKEIGDRGKMPKKVSVRQNGIEPQKSMITTSPPPRPEAPVLPAKSYSKGSMSSVISKWSKEQVAVWLESNNIHRLHSTLNNLNGEQLVQMRKQLARAPEFFHKNLKEELKLGFISILSLTAALDKLAI
ncbi:uncharacterized protein LOC121418766 [Lytechinus variegatus]|uniref:uncharacterized protein LOC121418766 n=1 Tax=Lytechinus variegatus TaxID=7654 RepID=UPI001BB1F791|nr:uncharacterized protein LOC121418766 [Lytechinus variegatus]XP_041468798.1 uncharacterized protein LOC121418766 [Lytechinus variegatus]XP_041468799.1 uncharacterized protein LOC121418766 [Lytechinus variegatus]